MTLEQQKKLAEDIMRLLKVRQVSLPLARTEKGDLSLKYVKDTEGYQIVLDAVPLDLEDFNNKELSQILEKTLFTDPLNINWTPAKPFVDDRKKPVENVTKK